MADIVRIEQLNKMNPKNGYNPAPAVNSVQILILFSTLKITDDIFVFEKAGGIAGRLTEDQLKAIVAHADGKIEQIEQSRYLYPVAPEWTNEDTVNHTNVEDMMVCSPFYDPRMGIEEAWTHNYTGNGVIIGVIDIGMDLDHPELEQNINKSLSYDFVKGINNYMLTKEWMFKRSASSHTNSANACGNSAAGVRRNTTCDTCGVGVSFNAKLVDLKVGETENDEDDSTSIFTDVDTLSRALTYKQNIIDIYVSEWIFEEQLSDADIAIESALLSGIREGRKGLGSIFVFPASLPGYYFMHDTFIISVGNIGPKHGRYHGIANSATLVSAITVATSNMSTIDASCFGHASASGIITGMIALVLQEKPTLTHRDITHILVQSADHRGLTQEKEFYQNGAGLFFHHYLGFGYPNSVKMINISKQWDPLPLQFTFTYNGTKRLQKNNKLDFFVNCDNDSCVGQIEEVVVHLWQVDTMSVVILASPMGTSSVLYQHFSASQTSGNSTTKKKVRLMSVHFWGENSAGKWTISCFGSSFTSVNLVLYGKLYTDAEKDAHVINITNVGTTCEQRNKFAEIVGSTVPLILMTILCIVFAFLYLRKKIRTALIFRSNKQKKHSYKSVAKFTKMSTSDGSEGLVLFSDNMDVRK